MFACMCECEWVGKEEREEEVNQDLDAAEEGGQSMCVCVAGEHGHYVDFPFSFKTLEEYFLFWADELLPPMPPDFMSRQGWPEGQKSGNQVNYGWRLADKSEREGSFFFFFFLVTCLNATGSSLHAWPDPAAYFVGSVVLSLTRYVLTLRLPLECHLNPPCRCAPANSQDAALFMGRPRLCPYH